MARRHLLNRDANYSSLDKRHKSRNHTQSTAYRRRLRFEPLEERRLLSISFTGAYSQNFDSLPTSGTNTPWVNDSTLPGWSLFRQPSPGTAITAINADDGSSNAGAFYSFGSTAHGDRALGGVGSGGTYFGSPAAGSVAGWMAVALTNTTGSVINTLDIHYTGEQWRDGGNTTAQTMTLEYGFGSSFSTVSTWTAPGANFNFASPIHNATAAALDGNAAANRLTDRGGTLNSLGWSAGGTLWVRWIENNDVGSDHGLAIDDVSIASSVTVDTLVDENDGDISPGHLSLREAVQLANTTNVSWINFAVTGTINLTALGQLNISDSVTINGPGSNLLTIKAYDQSLNTGDGTRVFNIDDGTASLIDVDIRGLKITGGDVAYGSASLDGGGIRSLENLTVRNSVITGNAAAPATGTYYFSGVSIGNQGGGGGGIWSSGNLVISNSSVSGNNSGYGAHNSGNMPGQIAFGGRGGDGGGIWASGALTILNSVLSDNLTGRGGDGGPGFFFPYIGGAGGSGGRGGAIWSSGPTTITSSNISDNETGDGGEGGPGTNGNGQRGGGGHGGGVYSTVSLIINGNSTINSNRTYHDTGPDVYFASRGDGGGIWSAGTTSITDSTISDNVAKSGVGISTDGVTTIVRSWITDNAAGNRGGGVEVRSSTAQTMIDSSTIDNNGASYGGGVWAAGTTTITNSTFSENQGYVRGGGLRIQNGTLTLSHSTVSGNLLNIAGDLGAGIHLGDPLPSTQHFISHSIIAGNYKYPSGPDDVFGAFAASFDLIGTNTNAIITDNGGNLVGNLLAPIDPKLGPLADNGGPTWTRRLLPGSPALDAGDSAFIGPPNVDQRGSGYPRVSNGRIDIGAFEAQQIVVDTLVDENDGNFSPGDLSLREAVALANGSAVEPMITFAPPIHGQTITLSLGQMTITGSMTVAGPGPNQLTIDANGASRIFSTDNGSSSLIDVRIEGLRFTNGHVTGVFDADHGGAIRNVENLEVVNCWFEGNSAQSFGGALDSGYGTLAVRGSRFTMNSTSARGGAISTSSNAVIENSTFLNNSATGAGGAINALAALTIDNSTISGNSTNSDGNGGGGVNAYVDVTVTNSIISGNRTMADHSSGGGLFANGYALIVNSTVSGNRTYGYSSPGGGVATNGGVKIVGSTISGNRTSGVSAEGGGVAGFGDVTIESSTISGNQTTGTSSAAGGVFAWQQLTVSHSTVTGNSTTRSGSSGGGLWGKNATIVLDHSIVAGNSSPGNDDIDAGTNPVSATYSLIGNNDGSGLAAAPVGMPDANGNLVGSMAAPINPLLGRLSDNGGPTMTHPLLPGSPAIDAGDSSSVFFPDDDQRGNPFSRIADGNGDSVARIDIGAYERQDVTPPINLVVDTLLDESDGNISAGHLSLREAVSIANGSIGADTITFASSLNGQTITLSLGQLNVTEILTIDASALTSGMKIDASGNDPTPTVNNGDGSRVVFVDIDASFQAVPIQLIGVMLTGGDVTGSGGAIYARGSVVLNGTQLVDNYSTSSGGGVRAEGDITVTDTVISMNATSGSGGGISSLGNVIVIGSTFARNSADFAGGGIYASGNLTLTDSTVSENEIIGSPGHGGGIRVGGDSVVTQSTVSNNSNLLGVGGGIYVSRQLFLKYSTVANNLASDGGGVYVADSGLIGLILSNSIIANNIGGGFNPNIRTNASGVNSQYSLIGDATGLLIFGTGNILNQDPLLGPIADNGGPTETRALLPGSPAINGGDPSAMAGVGDVPQFDQRGAGFTRVYGAIDIGAFEVQPAGPALPGDYNMNGTVDAADYVRWRKSLGTTGVIPFSGADGDGDGIIDHDDYGVWRANFGNVLPLGSGSAAALAESLTIPEPPTGLAATLKVLNDNDVQKLASYDSASTGTVASGVRQSSKTESALTDKLADLAFASDPATNRVIDSVAESNAGRRPAAIGRYDGATSLNAALLLVDSESTDYDCFSGEPVSRSRVDDVDGSGSDELVFATYELENDWLGLL